MALLLINGNFIEETQACLDASNRAFRYGDGLFETMAVKHGEIRYWTSHYDRLMAGMHIMDMDTAIFEQGWLYRLLQELVQYQDDHRESDLCIRLQVWRNAGGLFAPAEKRISWMAECRQVNSPAWTVRYNAGVSESVFLHKTWVSSFKTVSSLNYVLAGIEKNSREWDEILLLDIRHNISECLASNIFWLKGETVYTPSIETGCVDGIRRSKIIEKLTQQGFAVFEVQAPLTALAGADFVFTCNAVKLEVIKHLGDYTFSASHAVQHFLTDI